MKRRDLEQKLRELGWYPEPSQSGRGDHEKWTNGLESEPVPRHREINEYLAKKILKKAAGKAKPPRQ